MIDDDGAGEMADVVSLRVDGNDLVIRLDHCKFSSQDAPGARIDDLYVVCGQAEKSCRWRRDVDAFLRHLMRRERNRQKAGRPGLLHGTQTQLYAIADQAPLLRPRITIAIAQPGLSKAAVSGAQLELLACGEVYLSETANATFEVLCSE